MTTGIDEEVDAAVNGLGLGFNGVDGDVLSFVPLQGVEIEDHSKLLDRVFEALNARGLLDILPPNVNAIRIDES